MKRVHAPTLEEAYQKAANALNCSITDLQYEVIQRPSKGLLGLFKKEAVIVATCSKQKNSTAQKPENRVVTDKSSIVEMKSEDEAVIIEELHIQTQTLSYEEDQIVDGFFGADRVHEVEISETEKEVVVYDELARLIEQQLKELMELSCFDIDVVEVDVRDNTALIFIDGEDAALLIGKEGYRYNALSYMLFNWLHSKYELYIKLEIAEFLTSQQEMIRNYIKPVIESVQSQGRGKTRYLDGILVQIALEQLREAFPDKYVAVKTSRDGKKFVVINEFKK